MAQSASVGGADATTSTGAAFKLGKMSTGLFDIGGLLGFYGLVAGTADQAPKVVYKNFDFAGGSLVTPDLSCTFGEVTTAEFRARPLKVPFGDLMTMAQQMQAQKDNPSPEVIAKFVTFYTDLFSAFESSPVTMNGFDCSGKDQDGKALAFSIGPMSMGGFALGRYPAIDIKNVKISTGPDGKLSIGGVTLKGFDMTGPIKVLQNAAADLSADWFTANARKLIPAFEGFGFTDFSIDVPDDQNPGQRIKASIGDFDLALADYVNGVPTTIATASHHIVADLPAAGDDENLKQLEAMGIKQVDLGFDLALKRDATAKTIAIQKLALNGLNMGSISLSGTLGNADDSLFADDPDSAMIAAMGLTVKNLKLDVVDAGLEDVLLKQAGSAEGKDLAAMRTSISGSAQGLILIALGGSDEAKKLSSAIGDFLNGAKSVSIAVTAKDPAGLGMPELQAVESDPTQLAAKVTVDASAK